VRAGRAGAPEPTRIRPVLRPRARFPATEAGMGLRPGHVPQRGVTAVWTEAWFRPTRRPGASARSTVAGARWGERRPEDRATHRNEGAPLRLAALHRALPARSLRARPQRPARPARRADTPDPHAESLAQAREQPSTPSRTSTAGPTDRAMLHDAESDILAFDASPARTGPSCAPPTRSSAVTSDRAPHQRRRHLPDRQSPIRLTGMLCIEQNDKWLLGRAYLSAESLAPADHWARRPIPQTKDQRQSAKRPSKPTTHRGTKRPALTPRPGT
jgi:hypothetical protein